MSNYGIVMVNVLAMLGLVYILYHMQCQRISFGIRVIMKSTVLKCHFPYSKNQGLIKPVRVRVIVWSCYSNRFSITSERRGMN
jgi:hypothetical protein